MKKNIFKRYFSGLRIRIDESEAVIDEDLIAGLALIILSIGLLLCLFALSLLMIAITWVSYHLVTYLTSNISLFDNPAYIALLSFFVALIAIKTVIGIPRHFKKTLRAYDKQQVLES